jgi:hypothetical protein
VGGSVRGLSKGKELHLGLTANTQMNEHVKIDGSVQTSVIKLDGPFVFPYKLSKGTLYELTVMRDPPGQNCLVFFRSDAVFSDSLNPQVVCKQTPPPPTEYLHSRQCECYHCNSAGIFYEAQNCGGRSEGCAISQATGCYGKARNGTGGSCACTSGIFSEPELYSLGGVISGVLPTDIVVLKASSTGHMGHTVAQVAVANGALDGFAQHFMFSYDFREGQEYTVSVLSSPMGSRCVVKNSNGIIGAASAAASVAAAAAAAARLQNGAGKRSAAATTGRSRLTNTLRIICTGDHFNLGRTASVGQQAKRAWHEAEARRNQGGAGFSGIFLVSFLGFVVVLVWQQCNHRSQVLQARTQIGSPSYQRVDPPGL